LVSGQLDRQIFSQFYERTALSHNKAAMLEKGEVFREISRHEEIYTTQLTALQDKFGEVVSLLRPLSDFHLFALSPESGRYVAGDMARFTQLMSRMAQWPRLAVSKAERL
jgi:putative heme iron utilization protein